MEHSIRPAVEDDARSIVDLLNPLIRDGTFTVMDEPLTLEGQIDYMRGFPDRGVFNVAVGSDGRTVLGLQSVEPVAATSTTALEHVGDVSTFVSRDAHRRGIGRRLSEVTFAGARGRGFIKLCAAIRADNPGAVAFYVGQGFEVIGTARRHVRIAGRYVDEVLAERFLD